MNFRTLILIFLMATYVFPSPYRAADEPEFCSTVMRTLARLKIENGPSFTRAAGADGPNQRRPEIDD